MKKYLSIAVAALALFACTEKQDDFNNPDQTGEIEQSYIAVNLLSADVDTRADGDSYDDGVEAERKVNTVHFFFFRQGAPFPVNVTGTAPGGDKNWLLSTLSGVNSEGTVGNNISDYSNSVLVLNNYKGQYPDKIVAVINYSPDNKAYTLSELHDMSTSLKGNADGFVMSNSVYLSGTTVIDATPIAEGNIAATSEAAVTSPVEIYVERLSAKVKVTTKAENKFDTGNTLGGESVYVKVNNWSLYNANPTSSMLKNIDPAWTVDGLGFNWNDSPYYRSYWAQADLGSITNSLTWTDGLAVGNTDYCGENTDQDKADRTKVVLKGQLVYEDGTTPVELVKWNGQELVGTENLLKAAASQLQYTIYSEVTGTEKLSILDTDLTCVHASDPGAPSDIESYQVFFKLSDVGTTKTWFKVVEGATTGISVDEVNAYLKENLSPANVYAGGKTFYHLDIRHLAPVLDKPGSYGVVRNHVYDIAINSINGYGVPVFDPDKIITDIEYPEEEESVYVAAKINVLAWKVVSQEVDIIPQN